MTPTPSGGGGGEPGLNALFRGLAHERRRRVLYCLYEYEGAFTLEDLATYVAADEHGEPPDELSDAAVRPVRVSLHVRHLPTLVRAALVSYDRDTGTVALTEYGREVEPWIRGFVAPDASSFATGP